MIVILDSSSIQSGVRTCIGKETNRLDDTQVGLVADNRELVSTLHSQDTAIRDALARLSGLSGRALEDLTGLDRRTVDRIRRRGHASPRVEAAILRVARSLGS